MCFNRILVESILLFGLVLSIVGGSKAPAPQDDIPLFDAFIAENIDKVSDDPYISSTVKLGDKMYDFLVELQQGMVRKHTYGELLENGDSESKLWYARLSMYDYSVDRFQISHKLLLVLGSRIFQRTTDLMNDALLNLGIWIDGRDGFRETSQAIHTGDQDIFDATVIQICQHRKPVVSPFRHRYRPSSSFLPSTFNPKIVYTALLT